MELTAASYAVFERSPIERSRIATTKLAVSDALVRQYMMQFTAVCAAVIGLGLGAALPVARLRVVGDTPDDPIYFTIIRQGTNAVLVWNSRQLQWAPTVQGPWETITNAASPYTESAAS